MPRFYFAVLNWCTLHSIEISERTSSVVLVLHQPQVSSCMETTASQLHIDIPVEVTGGDMQSLVIVLKTPKTSG